MCVSQNNMKRLNTKDLILSIYTDSRYVFNLTDIAMLVGDTDFSSINKKLNYYVKKVKLLNPRRGIYAKPGYTPEEIACKVYTPSYISLEYVLQRAGVIFQYESRISAISYLSREIEIDGKEYLYHKVKGEILINTQGIEFHNNINIASAERAFLDMIYLVPSFYFDNLNVLDKKAVTRLLSVYNSKTMNARVQKLLKNDRY